jgi:hypothetical protein
VVPAGESHPLLTLIGRKLLFILRKARNAKNAKNT